MYYFSDKFLTGLKSKSENFQNEFFYVVDRLCQDSGDDQFIQAMIEQELSYDHPAILSIIRNRYGAESRSAVQRKNGRKRYAKQCMICSRKRNGANIMAWILQRICLFPCIYRKMYSQMQQDRWYRFLP